MSVSTLIVCYVISLTEKRLYAYERPGQATPVARRVAEVIGGDEFVDVIT